MLYGPEIWVIGDGVGNRGLGTADILEESGENS